MKKTNKDVAGTSYHDHNMEATPARLKQLLGEPDMDDNGGGDKVNLEWVRETDKGDVFTIYDYKTYHKLRDNEMVEWHIGAKNKEISKQAQAEVLALFSTLPEEPKRTDLCLVMEDITQAYEQGDIEHADIYTEMLKHNPLLTVC